MRVKIEHREAWKFLNYGLGDNLEAEIGDFEANYHSTGAGLPDPTHEDTDEGVVLTFPAGDEIRFSLVENS